MLASALERAALRVLDLPRELLDARLVVAEVVLEVLALIVERLDGLEVLGARLVGGDLRLELLDDHRRAPRAVLLGPQDVAVDVIADVEHLVAGRAERALEVLEVAALVDLAALERRLRGLASSRRRARAAGGAP